MTFRSAITAEDRVPVPTIESCFRVQFLLKQFFAATVTSIIHPSAATAAAPCAKTDDYDHAYSCIQFPPSFRPRRRSFACLEK